RHLGFVGDALFRPGLVVTGARDDPQRVVSTGCEPQLPRLIDRDARIALTVDEQHRAPGESARRGNDVDVARVVARHRLPERTNEPGRPRRQPETTEPGRDRLLAIRES